MKVRRWIYPAASLVFIGFAVILLVSALRSSTGEDAPDFELPLLDSQAGVISDRTLRLSDLKGSPVVINFWAAWCAPCRAETPLLVETYEKYKGQGVQFLGVDIWTRGENAESATGFLREFNVPYPTGPDINGTIFPAYAGAFPGIPTTVFITKEQKIFKKWDGPIDESNLVSLVEQLIDA